jgi:hypothetical protein
MQKLSHSVVHSIQGAILWGISDFNGEWLLHSEYICAMHTNFTESHPVQSFFQHGHL